MPTVEAVANTDFIHGDITASEGRVVRHRNGSMIDAGVAADLEKAGLVRIRITPTGAELGRSPGQVLFDEVGKSQDDGRGQPSSALPADPASPTTISNELRRGPGRPRKDT